MDTAATATINPEIAADIPGIHLDNGEPVVPAMDRRAAAAAVLRHGGISPHAPMGHGHPTTLSPISDDEHSAS
eukprot:scaffold37701_cov450-Skeletonema_dohrnii-CCMP3373.AAC.1